MSIFIWFAFHKNDVRQLTLLMSLKSNTGHSNQSGRSAGTLLANATSSKSVP